MPSLAQSVYNRPGNGPNIPSQEMASLAMGSQIKLSPAKCHIFCTEIETLNPGSRDIALKLRQTKCMISRFEG